MPATWFSNITSLNTKRDSLMNCRNDNGEQLDRKTSRSICDAVGERLQQDLRPEESALPSHLEHLMDELRKQDASSRRMLSN